MVAAEATMTAVDFGHDLDDEPRWRRLSRRVYAVPCARCERLVVISDVPSVGWKAGGSATTALCSVVRHA